MSYNNIKITKERRDVYDVRCCCFSMANIHTEIVQPGNYPVLSTGNIFQVIEIKTL